MHRLRYLQVSSTRGNGSGSIHGGRQAQAAVTVRQRWIALWLTALAVDPSGPFTPNRHKAAALE